MLIFDLDGTLLDSNGVWLEVDKTFLARRNAPYTKEYYEGPWTPCRYSTC